jgi:hypothetical protein
MPATLAQLLKVSPKAADALWDYFGALEEKLSENRLLTRFGCTMDATRMPLSCELWEQELDEKRALERERRMEAIDDDDDADRREKKASGRESRADSRHFQDEKDEDDRKGRKRQNSRRPLDEVASGSRVAAAFPVIQ